jgi:hypothetical protein
MLFCIVVNRFTKFLQNLLITGAIRMNDLESEWLDEDPNDPATWNVPQNSKYQKQDKVAANWGYTTAPRPEVGPVYQPPPPKKKNSEVTVCLLVFLVIACLIGGSIGGLILLTYIIPKPDVDLKVSLGYSGNQHGDPNTMYIDTDNILVTIKNHGKGTAKADKISLRASGSNIAYEDIIYLGVDLGPDEQYTQTISVTVVDEYKEFTLKISVLYDGKDQDSSSIP